jgi:nucleotide-binding universal stress UspA family protein
MFHKILAGYSGSESAKAALERAVVMAREYEVQLTALWVREQPLRLPSDLPGEFEDEEKASHEHFEELTKQVKAVAKAHGIDVDCSSHSGNPAKTMVQFAQQDGYDLIVVGHSQHSELWGRLLGDTADRIADHAHCSVLIVKQQK